MLNPEKVQMISERIEYTIFGKCYNRENYYFLFCSMYLFLENDIFEAVQQK